MRRSILAFLAAGSVLVSGGCESATEAITSSPQPRPLRLATVDSAYRLDAGERARLLPGFDAAALERLLGMVRLDLRQDILRYFQQREKGPSLGYLVQMNDPVLQTVLEEVWAPMWDEVKATDAQVEANHFGFPGREVAKQRRAARAQSLRNGHE